MSAPRPNCSSWLAAWVSCEETQLVRHGHRRHGPVGHAKRDTAHRHDQQLDCELRHHLDLFHADGGEYADLVLAFADVEQIEHDRTDRQYDDDSVRANSARLSSGTRLDS